MRTARFVVFACCSPFLAFAAGSDCATAITPQDKAICSDPALSKLSDDTAAAYDALVRQLSANGAGKVQEDRRQWLAWARQTCPDDANSQGRSITVCLTNRYTAQLQMLKDQPQNIDGIVFFPRVKVLTTPNTHPAMPPGVNPAFGVGRFSWPEIDHPTPEQANWNTAVRARVVKMSAPINQSSPVADFDAASVADADVSVSYALKAANRQFVSVALENGTYEYGAAHPAEYTISFQWWLDFGRVLKAEDVFRSNRNWQAFVRQRCYTKLVSGEHAALLYKENEVRAALADAVRLTENWVLSANGFEIHFSEYSVAPRYAGRISVTLNWDELKPYLAGSLNPADLPHPL